MAKTLKALAWTSVRWLLAAMLFYAGALKIAKPAAFIHDLENYKLVPPLFAFLLGLYLPWLEIATGVALLSRRWRMAGWAAAAALALGFVIFLTSAWARGLDVSCGCFGATNSPVGLFATARALALFILAAAGLTREFNLVTRSFAPTSPPRR